MPCGPLICAKGKTIKILSKSLWLLDLITESRKKKTEIKTNPGTSRKTITRKTRPQKTRGKQTQRARSVDIEMDSVAQDSSHIIGDVIELRVEPRLYLHSGFIIFDFNKYCRNLRPTKDIPYPWLSSAFPLASLLAFLIT